jgi:hypothetical protein
MVLRSQRVTRTKTHPVRENLPEEQCVASFWGLLDSRFGEKRRRVEVPCCCSIFHCQRRLHSRSEIAERPSQRCPQPRFNGYLPHTSDER